MTAGTELGGNKVRKLEFLLADALHGGYDSVITIGGEQSNHCRATVSFVPFHFAFVAQEEILNTKEKEKLGIQYY